MIRALAYIPIHEIELYLLALVESEFYDARLDPFIEYMRITWIGYPEIPEIPTIQKAVPAKPAQFAPQIWNVNER